MNLSALPFLIGALIYLGLGIWLLFNQKSRTQMLYGCLCLTSFLWQGIWALLFSHGIIGMMPWLRFCYSGIVFTPAILYHLMMEFTGRTTEWKWVRATYFLSAVLSALTWYDSMFVAGFYSYSWGPAARVGPLHPVFAICVAAVIVRVTILLIQAQRKSRASDWELRKFRVVTFATLLYCGGSLDLLSNYGVPIFPLSFIFLAGAFSFYGYAILRYEFLAAGASRETEEDRAQRQAASEEMRRMGMTAAFPLVSQGELLGYLLMGEKKSEEAYSKEDLRLLRIVANQAALAYQRVRYMEMAVHNARSEMLGEIAGGFAHEIKTPLANISLPAELSLLDLQDLADGTRSLSEVLPELQGRLKDIMGQTVKASEKIEAIRQFSKPGQVRLEPVSLEKILGNSLGLLDHLLKKLHIVVESHLPEKLSLVRGDPKQLEIVFVNLIKNAAEAMSEHPSAALARELTVKAREEGDWVVASVKDSGPGIKRGDVGHLFEAYFTTKGSEGTGMGLFLSQQVIKAHGGSIDVRSEEGQGTEFIIRLPKTAAQSPLLLHHAA